MKYIKNISIIAFSICLVFLPFSFTAQICSGASAAHNTHNKSLIVSSSRQPAQLEGISLKTAQKYTYYDADYDDTQNNLLAMQTLIERFASDMSDLGEEFIPALDSLDPKNLHLDLLKEWVGEKNILEKNLKSAGSDEHIQAQALKDYYQFLSSNLQDENIQQFKAIYHKFKLEFKEIKDQYFAEAKPNPYGSKLTDNARTKKINPLLEENSDLLAVAAKLDADLNKMSREFRNKTREKQILDRNYVGMVGQWQKLSDFIAGKGKFAK